MSSVKPARRISRLLPAQHSHLWLAMTPAFLLQTFLSLCSKALGPVFFTQHFSAALGMNLASESIVQGLPSIVSVPFTLPAKRNRPTTFLLLQEPIKPNRSDRAMRSSPKSILRFRVRRGLSIAPFSVGTRMIGPQESRWI